jgi:hypothetical protein
MSDADRKITVALAQARHEGYLAGRRGRTGAANPYEGDTPEARAWLVGLLDGRTKRLNIVGGVDRPCD